MFHVRATASTGTHAEWPFGRRTPPLPGSLCRTAVVPTNVAGHRHLRTKTGHHQLASEKLGLGPREAA